MSETIIGIILGGGGVVLLGVVGYLLKSRIGKQIISGLIANSENREGVKVTGADVEVENKPKDNFKPENTPSYQEAKRREDEIRDSLKILLCAILLGASTKIMAIDKEKLNQYMKDNTEYIRQTEEEFNAIRQNIREDTEITVSKVKPTGTIFIKMSIPTKQPVLTPGGVKREQSAPITRDFRVTPKFSVKMIKYGFTFDPDILLGGSLTFPSSFKRNILVGLETFVFNGSEVRIALTPFIGLPRYGLTITFGSVNYLRNLRFIIGTGGNYNTPNELSFEIGLAAAIGM